MIKFYNCPFCKSEDIDSYDSTNPGNEGFWKCNSCKKDFSELDLFP